MKRTLMAGLIAGMLVLSGCGGSSGKGASSGKSDSGSGGLGGAISSLSGNDSKAAKSISDAIMKSEKKSGEASDLVLVNKSAADCIGKGLVDKVGTNDLVKYGLLTKDMKTKTNSTLTTVTMSKDDAEGAADVMTGCVDLKAMMQKAMASSLNSLPPKVKACFTNALTDDAIHGMFVGVFSGKSTEAGKALSAPMAKCAQKATQ
jgi:hypothetical protein